jgi:peptide/nickel transport system substrate-binding protein
MRLRRKSVAMLALLLCLSLVAAACGGDGDDGGTTQQNGGDEGEPQTGGTLIFGAEQEPAVLNTSTTSGNLFWGVVIAGTPILEGAYQVQPDFTFAPQLLEGEVEVGEDPFTLTYNIHPDAAWSDGEPITADDFIFTAEVFNNPDFDLASRTGYELITKSEKVDDKTVTFTLKSPFAGYKTIFDPVLPKHALEGEDFDKVWNNEIVNPKNGEPIGSGPFLFEDWKKGTELSIVRNEGYWGEHPAYLDKIIFRFVTDTNTEIQAMKAEEVDMIYPQVQLALTELIDLPGIGNDIASGPVWQHLDFQFGNEVMAEPFVRQAISQGIDRQAIVDTLVKQIQPDAEVLHNAIYVPNQPEYEPHFDIWEYNVDAARQTLEDNGCTEGADGIYECNGQKLEFGYVSTSANELRELMFEIIQANLKDVGIKVNNEFGEADVVFGKVLSSKKWDMFQFAWVGSPDPTGSNAIFTCGGEQNYNDYCNEEATSLMDEAETTVDHDAQTDLYNQADALMAEDLPLLPLWQLPNPWFFKDTINGLQNNPTNEGPTWNAGDWWIEQ